MTRAIDKAEAKRGVRSFVLRQGRLTKGQSKALIELMPIYGLSVDTGPVDLPAIFQNSNKVCLEIGFGMGESLLTQAATNPEWNYVGVEVHRPGLGHLLMGIDQHQLDNVRVFAQDTVEVLNRSIIDKSLDAIQVFFPDPWPKKRHHKRRLIDDVFIELTASKLKPGGVIHIATDWPHYAEEIADLFENVSTYIPESPPERPVTKFERRGQNLDHTITDLAYRLADRLESSVTAGLALSW